MSDLYKESRATVNRESYTEETGNRTGNNATFFVAMKRDPEDIVRENWKDFGRWVFETRDRLNLTQEQCAQRAGMKRQQWNRIEGGASTKRVTVLRIADALNVDHATALEKAGFLPKATRKSSDDETVEETLRNARFFGGKGVSDEEIKEMRPLMEALDRFIAQTVELRKRREGG